MPSLGNYRSTLLLIEKKKKKQPYVRLRCAAAVMDLTWFCFSLEDPKNLKIQKKNMLNIAKSGDRARTNCCDDMRVKRTSG